MLQLKGISKKLGDFRLKSIILDVQENEYFIILGPTGTGKTVILELIAGMYKPDQGEIYYNKQRIDHLPPEQRKVGFVYQDYALFPHLSVKDNIMYGLRSRKIAKREAKTRFDEITANLKIGHLLGRVPATLSGGEQQRIAIARALITRPDILLLDEPLSALDPNTRGLFQQELRRLHEDMGTTTVHITHDFSEALALGDRIAVMQDGGIVQVGPAIDVFRQPKSLFVAGFVGAVNIFSGFCDNQKISIAPGLEIAAVCKKKGETSISIRPEDILISRETFISSARNSLEGEITEMICQGPLYRITLDCGVLLQSLVSFQSVAEMDLKKGDRVWATFKTTAVNVFY
ncbi:MAG: ABC transporter ATP-binding protein [Bacillota bacterium]|nr:ABC transporter ATP-binding protein [Bacillota bacterium]